MKETLKIIPSAILAGICIAIGGTVFATIGGLAGAVLFSFGLLAVVHYGLHLYTGKAGFFCSWKGIFQLLTVILFGNVLGCYLTGLIAQPNVVEACQNIVSARLSAGYLTNFLLAIPCGFIMTTAVEFGRKQQFLPLLFGVPVFIMCGFRHSIADAFYYCAAAVWTSELVYTWLLIVAGNFIGCNLYRALMFKSN
jgi:formate/nitrite transporter FocA (FNT family)